MKKRIRFDKTDDMIYISHLDTMRAFERLMKKTDLKVKFSEGFHPRPKMSFGNPVSLGVIAYNEYMDLELLEEIDNEVLLEKLNEYAPKGIKFTGCQDVPRKSMIVNDFPIMQYKIEGPKETIEILLALFAQDEILEEKEKRGKIKVRNLKEKIIEYKTDGNEVLLLEVQNSSPNAFLKVAGVKPTSVEMTKLGYKELN